jgi:hypothetical protein
MLPSIKSSAGSTPTQPMAEDLRCVTATAAGYFALLHWVHFNFNFKNEKLPEGSLALGSFFVDIYFLCYCNACHQ